MRSPLLHTQALSIHAGKKLICQHFNWQIQSGEIWGLTGDNGMGKTTLLHTLAGLHPLTTGSIFLNGKNIQKLSLRERACHRGVLFQETRMDFPQRIYDYCLAGRSPHQGFLAREAASDREHVRKALMAMNLWERAGETIMTLSGGEKRRLNIATLLAQKPRLYLLDEPFNHLDWKHQHATLHILQQLAQKEHAGILIILHDLRLLQTVCTHVLQIQEDGEVKICEQTNTPPY